jgi:predicted helicase
VGGMMWDVLFCTNSITEFNLYRRGGNCLFPLYIYPTEKSSLFDLKHETRKANFSPAFILDLESRLNLKFIDEGNGDFETTISALDIFNYMYAVFHSPTYRTRYAEFLKMDFPRLPLTSDKALFQTLANFGAELVAIHLMNADIENDCCFDIKGDNVVEKIEFKDNKVFINKTQYFDNVSPEVWNFHIGGYQVCNKWLKDRKGRALNYDDCKNYLYILAALEQTQNLMVQIDESLPIFPIH